MNSFWGTSSICPSKCPHALIEVSTNLSVLRKDIFEAIKKCDIDDFRISCFGFFKETYEKVMPGLKYETFLSNMEYLLDFGTSMIAWRMCP